MRELAAEEIVGSQRDDKLRVSLHLYNVDDDVDRVLDALRGSAATYSPERRADILAA